MNSTELIRLQIELEYSVNTAGLLVPFPDSTERARFIIYHHTGGYVTYFRYDLPRHTRKRIAGLSHEQAFNDHEAVKRILVEHAPCEEMWVGKSCIFPASPKPGDFPDVACKEGCHVVMVAGEAVAWAWSVRENEVAAEAAVETLSAFRRRGYGRQVTAAWAHHVMKQGKVAFYSYASDNLAPEALAQSLGLVQYAAGVAYD